MKLIPLYIEIKRESASLWFKFTQSETGTLDYAGKCDALAAGTIEACQKIDSSMYYSPSWYIYLPKQMIAEISVYLPQEIGVIDTGHYSFLVHIGAILLSIEERDTLLVAELLHRRSTVFASYTSIMTHILKPVAAEALFAWAYGAFNGEAGLLAAYNGAPATTGETNVAAILLAAASDVLKPDPGKERANEMFTRYFRQKISFDFTIGIVGANCHRWVDGLTKLDEVFFAAKTIAIAGTLDPIGTCNRQKQDFVADLATTVQAEPYNPHDHNAISVSIDCIESRISGMGGKSKAGYLRATGAKILRAARPEKFTFNAELWRIGGNPNKNENAIIIRLKM